MEGIKDTIALKAEHDIYLLSLVLIGANSAVIHTACEVSDPDNFVTLTPETRERYVQNWGEVAVTGAQTFLRELDELKTSAERV